MAPKDVHKMTMTTKCSLNVTYLDKVLKVFMDDFNIHCMAWEEHLEHLQFVLMKLTRVNLKFNLEKCGFANTSINILGHVMSREGI